MTPGTPPSAESPRTHRVRSDLPFFTAFILLSAFYVLLIAGLITADLIEVTFEDFKAALRDEKIQYAIMLSAITCTITAILSIWVAVPIGYLMSRFPIPGKSFIDACLDIPIVLPPLVIGLSLLVLFGLPTGGTELAPVTVDDRFKQFFTWAFDYPRGIVFQIPAVILAQFMVACAFAVRTMRATFDQINTRQEDVALTLGCSRSQAFWAVVLPQAWRGVITAGTLAWARSLGEFGPILIFAGSVRMRTEVMSTSVFLAITLGNIEGALAVSLIMILAAVAVLMLVRITTGKSLVGGGG